MGSVCMGAPQTVSGPTLMSLTRSRRLEEGLSVGRAGWVGGRCGPSVLSPMDPLKQQFNILGRSTVWI